MFNQGNFNDFNVLRIILGDCWLLRFFRPELSTKHWLWFKVDMCSHFAGIATSPRDICSLLPYSMSHGHYQRSPQWKSHWQEASRPQIMQEKRAVRPTHTTSEMGPTAKQIISQSQDHVSSLLILSCFKPQIY